MTTNISDEIVDLLNNTEVGEMNLYEIAQELERNPGSIRRVMNSLLKSRDVREIILCPHCGSDIHHNTEKRYSLRIMVGRK